MSISSLKEKYPILKYISNKYILVLVFFIVWMLFLDNYSYLEHRILNKEINELENNKNYYINEKRKDSIQIKKLQNPDQIEKYAREKYYMKRDSEDVYIIDYEKEIEEEENNKNL